MRVILILLFCCSAVAQTADTKQTATYKRIRAALDQVSAIDTHDHLWPFETLPGYVETERGHGMNLSSIWRNSYYTWFNSISNDRRRARAKRNHAPPTVMAPMRDDSNNAGEAQREKPKRQQHHCELDEPGWSRSKRAHCQKPESCKSNCHFAKARHPPSNT